MVLQSAPFFDEIAEGPDGGAAYWLTTSDGVRIRVGHWTPPNAKGTVFLFPGRTEYIEKYGRAAADLYQRGYATITIDFRGQGLADRMLEEPRTGHVDQFTDYQNDVAAMLRVAGELDLPKPFFLIAHSMGGCIGLRALNQGFPAEAVVFSGPMWGIRISAVMRPIAWALAWGSGFTGQGHHLPPGSSHDPYVKAAPFEDNMLTRDADMYTYMIRQLDQHPDLCLGGPSLHWLGEALRETRHLSTLASPALPCLTYVGSNERIVDVDRLVRRMDNWPGGRLEVIELAEHEVIMEGPAIRNRIFDASAAFFAENSDKGAESCSA
ncbi:MAG: alpha/beta hydrolase [Paracoccaceae bacterium]